MPKTFEIGDRVELIDKEEMSAAYKLGDRGSVMRIEEGYDDIYVHIKWDVPSISKSGGGWLSWRFRKIADAEPEKPFDLTEALRATFTT